MITKEQREKLDEHIIAAISAAHAYAGLRDEALLDAVISTAAALAAYVNSITEAAEDA